MTRDTEPDAGAGPSDLPRSAATAAGRRGIRWRIVSPSLLLLVLAVGWSVAWLVLRDRTVAGLDAWLAGEAAAGKTWTCRDRSVGGFPFRIELRCQDLTFARADATASLGRVVVVSQVYNPSHVIAEVAGPLSVRSDDVSVEGSWSLLQASLVTGSGGLGRFALALDAPRFRVTPRERPAIEAAGRRFEVHLRPDPAVPGAFDVGAAATGTAVPLLDAVFGGPEPADLDLVATVTHGRVLPVRPVPADLERWRLEGGGIDASRIALAKGSARIDGRGTLALDETHRPAGRLDLATAGLEGAVSRVLGERAGLATNLIGALLGGGIAPRPGAAPDLKPLPPIRLEGGRVRFGPLTVPGLRVDPLY